MSSEATAWVFRTGTRQIPSRLLSTLHAIAERADEYGRKAYLKFEDTHLRACTQVNGRARCVPGLCLEEGMASRTGVSLRQAYRRVAELEKLGIIRRGDQSILAHLHPRHRPIVWEIPGVAESLACRSGGLVTRRDI